MRRVLNILAVAAMIPVMVSCLFDNDMAYPRVKGAITEFEVADQKSVTIDDESQSVSIVLNELADITKVRLLNMAVSEMSLYDPLPSVLDLTKPYSLSIATYPDQVYDWTISAVQPIDRYVRCAGLIEAQFNVADKTVLVYVTDKTPLDHITIEAMKLEPETSVIVSTTGHRNENGQIVEETQDVAFPMTLDCTLSREFLVLWKGENIIWTVTFMQKAVENEIKSVSAWTYHAVVSGEFDGEGTPYLEYRKASENAWISFDEVAVDGVKVTGDITGLEEGTDYAVRLVSPSATGQEYTFRTDSPVQLSNMSFEDWSKDGETFYPNAADAAVKDWSTANKAVSIAGAISGIYNTTTPEYDHVVDGDVAVKIISVAPAGVFAAGNLFTGEFFRFHVMTAYLKWGVPFTSRPYSLKGYYDYSPKIIDKVKEEYPQYKEMLGKKDFMQLLAVLVADGDTPETQGPFDVVSSEPGKPNLRTDPRVIAFGTLESDEDTGGEYREFEIVFDYRDDRQPSYIIIVACSSLYGDFFTGAVGSTLYVDDFELMYR